METVRIVETAQTTSGTVPRAARSSERRSRLLMGTLALVLLFGVLLHLGSRSLYDPDEGRNAEVMREMAVSRDFVVPHLNGLPFLDKPFLYFTAGGLSILLFGANEAAVRLPALLCTIATLLLVGAFAGRWPGGTTGRVAALTLATTPLVLAYSQIVIFDAMLTLWITAAVLALHRAVETEPGDSRVPWVHLAWAAMALGVLTKGPVAVLVPLATAIPWAIWRHRVSRLWNHGAPVVLVLLVGPWVWAVMQEDPRFLDYVLFTETISRLSDNQLNRDAPVWYYLPFLLFGALPWSLVPFAGWRAVRDAWRQGEPTVRFLLSWLTIPFVLFSIMHSKRPHYILPILPALALLAVWIWSRRGPGETLPGARAGAAIWVALGLLLVALGAGAAPDVVRELDRFDARTVSRILLGLGAAWTGAGILAWRARRSLPLALFAFALPSIAVLVLGAPLITGIGEERSARTMARAVESAGPAGTEVVAIGTYPPSLSFYLGRTVTLATADGDPLRSNYLLRRYSDLVDVEPTLRSPAWLAEALLDCEPRRLFLVEHRRRATREDLERFGRKLLAESRSSRLYGDCTGDGESER